MKYDISDVSAFIFMLCFLMLALAIGVCCVIETLAKAGVFE